MAQHFVKGRPQQGVGVGAHFMDGRQGAALLPRRQKGRAGQGSRDDPFRLRDGGGIAGRVGHSLGSRIRTPGPWPLLSINTIPAPSRADRSINR